MRKECSSRENARVNYHFHKATTPSSQKANCTQWQTLLGVHFTFLSLYIISRLVNNLIECCTKLHFTIRPDGSIVTIHQKWLKTGEKRASTVNLREMKIPGLNFMGVGHNPWKNTQIALVSPTLSFWNVWVPHKEVCWQTLCWGLHRWLH